MNADLTEAFPGGAPLAQNSPLTSLNAAQAAETIAVQEQAEQLRLVAAQIDQFLHRNLDRLERQIANSANRPAGVDTRELDGMVSDFQAMKQKWDVERQLERQSLSDDAQRLAEAWQRLEQEQRELLRYRSTMKAAPSTTLPTTQGTEVAAQASVVRGEPKTPPAVAAAYAPPAAGPVNSGKNQLQFQQLRREMMEHARQGRKR